ncbi:DUF4488 domain-containing protein [Bacteroides sp.]|uniref:DUF4488 domain-containing protein n=1 Tax=Bacteroides sp. TaxID=29523 RepID=UPI00258BEA43|nr:DUF4488 domain-containing protein [Bacteroides sp.]
MKMRKFLFLALSLLVVSGSALAQSAEKVPISLNGVWQMCFYRSNSPDVAGELKTSNSLKILSDDGRFTNLVMMPHGAIIIGEGTYEMTSEKSYTEIVERNLHLPQLNGKKNVMEFEMKDDGIMVVKYFLKEDINGNRIDSWCYETWKRVSMPEKYPENIIR